HLRQRQRARLRAVAADDDQAVDAPRLEVLDGARPHLLVLELAKPRAAQKRPAPLQDPADVAGPQRLDQAAHQPGVAVAYAERFPTHCDAHAAGGADGGVHPGCVTAAGQDRDLPRGHAMRTTYSMA